MSGNPDLIYFDGRVEDNVHGWFSIEDEAADGQYRDVPIEIFIGRISFGYARRSLPRSDVDAIFPQRGAGPKGFNLPLCALFAFARLCDPTGSDGLSMRIGERAFQGPDFSERLQDPALLTTFRSSLQHACVVHVVDSWLASASTLRLRLDPTGPDAGLRFYQLDVAAEPPGIAFAGEARRVGGSDQIIDVALINPLAPLLVTMFDSDDMLIGADLVPFPSLCRGGLHAAELAALGPTGDPSADVRSVGGALLVEWLAERASGELLAKVVIDAQTATGAEPMFSESVLSWLRGHLGVAVEMAGRERRIEMDSGDESAIDYLQSQIERAVASTAPRRDNGSVLTIPANAVPTISALLTRRLWTSGEGDRSAVGSLIVEDTDAGTPRWLMRPAIERAGPDTPLAGSDYAGFPRVSAPGARRLSPLAANLPMAIKRRWSRAAQPLTLLHPVAQDAPAIVTSAPDASSGMSVLVVLSEDTPGLGSLLTSLAVQDYLGPIEVLVHEAGSPPRLSGEVAAALESSFAGRHRMIRADAVVPRGVAFQQLAGEAAYETLVFLDERIVLHDQRSLGVLSAIAGATNVGSASCMVLNKGRDTGHLSMRSAGYLPGRLDLTSGSAADVAFVDTFDLIGPCTYPVVANTSELLVTRRDAWRAMGGFDTLLFPRTRFDVDFGLRVIEAGLRNVVTTTISALCLDGRERRAAMDLHAPFLQDVARLSASFSTSLTARRL